MITNELFMTIRYLHTFEGLSSTQIAEKLRIPARTVRNWWNEDFYPVKMKRIRHKLIGDYAPEIERFLSTAPSLTGTQIYRKLRERGYQGSVDVVRRYLSKTRPKSRRTYLSLTFEPGEAAQLDFGDCGLIHYGDKRIRLHVCAMVLCYSRMLYAELIPSEKLEHTLAFVMNGFQFFGGVPRKLIIDNFKGAVESHSEYGATVYNKAFLDFCAHFGTLPVACNVCSPQEKGRIENGIGYIKGNFFNGSTFSSLEEARHSLRSWLDNVANVRIHGTTRKQPLELFNNTEKAALLELNTRHYDCARLLIRTVDSQCRISCDGNRYSVPEKYAYKPVSVRLTAEKVLIYFNDALIASHLRSFGTGNAVTDPSHVKLMLEERKTAARQNLKSDFLALGKSAAIMLEKLSARLLNPEEHIRKIMVLADMHGKDAVVRAMDAAVDNSVYGADYIEHIVRIRQQPVENALGHLHVTQGADNLKIAVDEPDFNIYDIH